MHDHISWEALNTFPGLDTPEEIKAAATTRVAPRSISRLEENRFKAEIATEIIKIETANKFMLTFYELYYSSIRDRSH